MITTDKTASELAKEYYESNKEDIYKKVLKYIETLASSKQYILVYYHPFKDEIIFSSPGKYSIELFVLPFKKTKSYAEFDKYCTMQLDKHLILYTELLLKTDYDMNNYDKRLCILDIKLDLLFHLEFYDKYFNRDIPVYLLECIIEKYINNNRPNESIIKFFILDSIYNRSQFNELVSLLLGQLKSFSDTMKYILYNKLYNYGFDKLNDAIVTEIKDTYNNLFEEMRVNDMYVNKTFIEQMNSVGYEVKFDYILFPIKINNIGNIFEGYSSDINERYVITEENKKNLLEYAIRMKELNIEFGISTERADRADSVIKRIDLPLVINKDIPNHTENLRSLNVSYLRDHGYLN